MPETLAQMQARDAISRAGYIICPLCSNSFDDHTVMVESVEVHGNVGVKHIGWRCPGA